MSFPDDQIKISAECIEMDAVKNFCKPYKGDLPSDGNIYYYEFSPECLIVLSASNILLGNRILGAGLDSPITGDLLKEFISIYKKAGRPKFMIQTSPLVLNEKSKAVLEENKFIHKGNWAKFVKSAEDVNTESVIETNEVKIRKSDEKDFKVLSEILTGSFGFPPEMSVMCFALLNSEGWTTFTGFLNDKISGSASVYIKGEHAELGAAATAESARGHGIQSALIKSRELFAVKNNCKYLFVETAEPTPEYRAPSYRNMIKSGYTELYRRPNYVFNF